MSGRPYNPGETLWEYVTYPSQFVLSTLPPTSSDSVRSKRPKGWVKDCVLTSRSSTQTHPGKQNSKGDPPFGSLLWHACSLLCIHSYSLLCEFNHSCHFPGAMFIPPHRTEQNEKLMFAGQHDPFSDQSIALDSNL